MDLMSSWNNDDYFSLLKTWIYHLASFLETFSKENKKKSFQSRATTASLFAVDSVYAVGKEEENFIDNRQHNPF